MSGRYSPNIKVMVGAAEKAGRALVRDFGEVEQLQVSRKGPGDFVSTADLKAERILKEELEKARPKYGFLLEEGGEIKGEDDHFKWIIDPLDGTINYLHGVPHWCVSIALEKDGEIVAAVIHEPISGETFHAEKGCGAFSSSKRLRVASRSSFSEALLTTGDDIILNNILAHPGCSIRRMGSACLDLAYVAAGRVDAYWEKGLQPWDKAAGLLLVKEAGGYVSEINGGKNTTYGKGIVAANPTLHTELVKQLTASVTKKVAT